MKPDFYQTLAVAKNSSAADIKSAYRKLALQYHPDRNKSTDAEAKFKQINEAYEVLSDPQKRQAYDQFGHAAFDPGSPGFGGHTYSSQDGPSTFSWRSSGGSDADFDFGGFSSPFDIFEQFFGAGFGSGHRLSTYKIQISFVDAVKGGRKDVNINGQKRSVTIPAGVDDGQRIRFKDFILYIDVLPDPVFKRDGLHLIVQKEISISQAVLGDTVDVPALDDKPLKIKIKPGTQSHTLVRLKGKGIKDPNGFGRGDLYIRILVTIPTRLTRQQKQLFKKLE